MVNFFILSNLNINFFFYFRMMRMHEHGLQNRENVRLYTEKPKCTTAGGNFVTASLVDTSPAMLVLVWGFAFAIAMLLMEMLVNRFWNLKKNKILQQRRLGKRSSFRYYN